MNGLSLFSGIGGIDVALSDVVRPIAYCEIDPFCQAVLLSRMATGDLVHAPIWDDIKTLRICRSEIDIDIIYGGFPCQDISIAGHGKGLEGERSGLFFEIVRLCREIKPRFIFLENVPAITSRGGTEVVREITAMGYDCRWCIISAASVGALHRRERWFLLANAQHERCLQSELQERSRSEKEISQGSYSLCESDIQSDDKADTTSKPIDNIGYTWGDDTRQYWPFESREHWQKIVSEMGKCSDGISNHMDRLKSLGNSVVPAQVREAFKMLMGLK